MAAIPENLCVGGHPQARSACSPTGDPLPSTSAPRGGTPGPGRRARGRLVWDQSPSLALGARLPAAAPAGTTDGGGLCSRSFQDVLLPLPLPGLRWAADYPPSQRRPVNVGEQPCCTRHHSRPRKPEVRRCRRAQEQVSGDGPPVSVTAVWGCWRDTLGTRAQVRWLPHTCMWAWDTPRLDGEPGAPLPLGTDPPPPRARQ